MAGKLGRGCFTEILFNNHIRKGLASAVLETAMVTTRTKKQNWWNLACEESLEKKDKIME